MIDAPCPATTGTRTLVATHRQVGQPEDLARLGHHLDLFAREPVGLELADLGHDVVGDRLAEHLAR